ncbi:MAG: LysR family transcriptional regulator [Holosporales bacterium]|jgi:DNA-binding transcriptional LysR family regulator|nr:LysR family transcriptional regulator [Holosporales bacterium]
MKTDELDIFAQVCENGVQNISKKLNLNDEAVLRAIRNLESDIGTNLFVQEDFPSTENLTAFGKAFLPLAIKIIDEITSGILDIYEKTTVLDRLIFMSSLECANAILLPSIQKIIDLIDAEKLKIDIITSPQVLYSEMAKAHILLRKREGSGSPFQDKKWSVRIGQGLFASEGYLVNIKNIPQKEKDLQMHSIIAYEESSDFEMNWHLLREYNFNPAMLVNNQTTLIAAIEAGLGIGPVWQGYEKLSRQKLYRILPEITGPDIILDFSVRKMIPNSFTILAERIAMELKSFLVDIGLEILEV